MRARVHSSRSIDRYNSFPFAFKWRQNGNLQIYMKVTETPQMCIVMNKIFISLRVIYVDANASDKDKIEESHELLEHYHAAKIVAVFLKMQLRSQKYKRARKRCQNGYVSMVNHNKCTKTKMLRAIDTNCLNLFRSESS